eukprot:TRINITY_DN67733_c0_g1_i1.p1 TRINITY_DN67733_c0_g1~~TRINITY_DN67733_c0_g1_i1.p1  ORF type:complete len:370 (+),score=54.96 TRINITY_DN67733_c0_g1_i1:119-1111(+)
MHTSQRSVALCECSCGDAAVRNRAMLLRSEAMADVAGTASVPAAAAGSLTSATQQSPPRACARSRSMSTSAAVPCSASASVRVPAPPGASGINGVPNSVVASSTPRGSGAFLSTAQATIDRTVTPRREAPSPGRRPPRAGSRDRLHGRHAQAMGSGAGGAHEASPVRSCHLVNGGVGGVDGGGCGDGTVGGGTSGLLGRRASCGGEPSCYRGGGGTVAQSASSTSAAAEDGRGNGIARNGCYGRGRSEERFARGNSPAADCRRASSKGLQGVGQVLNDLGVRAPLGRATSTNAHLMQDSPPQQQHQREPRSKSRDRCMVGRPPSSGRRLY